MEIKKIIFVCLYLIICIMPIVLINRNDIYLSDVDNRYLLKKSDMGVGKNEVYLRRYVWLAAM